MTFVIYTPLITFSYIYVIGRTDMITMQAMSWNKRKVLNMGQALVKRYIKVELSSQSHIAVWIFRF